MIRTSEKPSRAPSSESGATLRAGALRSAEAARVISRSAERTSSRATVLRPNSSERLCRGFALVACALIAAHLLTKVFRHTNQLVPAALRPIFDMAEESSLCTWFSVLANLVLGVLVFALARLRRERSLYAIGGFFVFLSMDDQAMLHERIGTLTWDALQGSGTYPWLLAVAPVFGAFGFFAFMRLWKLCDAHSQKTRLVLGFACLALAIGAEWIQSRIDAQRLRWRGFELQSYTVPIEEGLELLGPALLIACVGTIYERARRAS